MKTLSKFVRRLPLHRYFHEKCLLMFIIPAKKNVHIVIIYVRWLSGTVAWSYTNYISIFGTNHKINVNLDLTWFHIQAVTWKVGLHKKGKPKDQVALQALLYTSISRKVVGKNVHATTPKGNMGYDQYTVPNDCGCRTYFCCFPLILANIGPGPLVPFFQISLENRADKTTHNTFRDCRVHFFRQPFSKQLYPSPSISRPL